MGEYFTKEYFIKWTGYFMIIIVPFGIIFSLKKFEIISNDFYNNINNLFLSVYTGIGASYLFLRFYLFYKKPKIIISDYICEHEIDGKKNFLFKFVNKTDVELYDLRVEASILTPFNEGDGKHLRGKPISFIRSNIDFLPKKTNKDDYNLHAIRIRTTDDIKSIWSSSESASYLRLTIIAKHSLSGFNRVFTKDFLDHKKIVTDKMFKKGDCLDVD